jgi:hypothetical protein
MAAKDIKDIRVCRVCERTMVSQHSWHNGMRRGAETYCHKDNGMCRACDQRLERAERRRLGLARRDRPPRPPRGYVRREETESYLDEYDHIRDSVSHIREAAARLGITFARLDKMLYRARKLGDPRGRPPLEQLERAIDTGAAFGRQHPHRPRLEEAA